jgi:hypothetical protein
VAAPLLFIFKQLSAMSKIKTGILGAYSGTIGSVTGYRRNGKNIIQGINQRKDFVLNSSMVYRHNMIKNFNTWFLQWNATWRVRMINTLNPLMPKDERLRSQFYEEYGQFDRLNKQHGNIFGIKQALRSGLQYSYNKTTRILKCTWINAGFTMGGTLTPQTVLVWICIESNDTVWSQSQRNINTDIYNVTIPIQCVGKKMFAQIGAIGNSSQNPVYMQAFPAMWFIA